MAPLVQELSAGAPPREANRKIHVSKRLLIEPIGGGCHLVFNPLSGSVDLLDNSDVDLLADLSAGRDVAIGESIEQQFRDHLFVYDSADDEEELIERQVKEAWDRMRTDSPEVYTICPTLACNLACGYCFEGDSLTDKKQGVMTPTQVLETFQAIDEYRRQQGFDVNGIDPENRPYVTFFGGEPFLPSTRQAVELILKEASKRNFAVGGTTNGVNLTRFEDLFREYAEDIVVLQISLDGAREVHNKRRYRLGGQGTFDEIVRGIDMLIGLGINVDLRSNIDAGNIEQLPEFAEWVISKGWHETPHLRVTLAQVTMHTAGGCGINYDKSISELQMARRVMELMAEDESVRRVCNLGFLRHLEHLVATLEPDRFQGSYMTPDVVGPRYWYCEASTGKNLVFTPEGLIYTCTEGLGHFEHAVGSFEPKLDMWKPSSATWVGRTILSHPKCRACSVSTLCGGGCNLASKDRAGKELAPLIQLQMSPSKSAPLTIPQQVSPKAQAAADPYCGMAEDIVRTYLRSIGPKYLEETSSAN